MKQKIISFSLRILMLSPISLTAAIDHSISTHSYIAHAEQPTSDHGERRDVGTIRILNKEFSITQLGELIPGEEGAFEVSSKSGVTGLTAYIWIESKEGKKLSAPSKGIPEEGNLHFHVLPNANSTPYQIVLRIREGTHDERASLPLKNHLDKISK